MSGFGVSPAVLHSAAAAIGTEGAAIQTALDDLDRDVEQLRAQWDGAAKEAYSSAQRAWLTEVAAMRDLLSRIAAMTDGIADGYVETDAAAAKRFSHS